MKLLGQLCEIQAPSGHETAMKDFIIAYVKTHSHGWEGKPEIISGPGFQDCVMLKFGHPKTAVFTHIDSTGFTVRYENQLVPIGGPEARNGYRLVGKDSLSMIACELEVNEDGNLFYKFPRAIERGTELTYACNFRETRDYVQSCYLDNRLGVYCALQLSKTLKNGIIVFSTREEHGGGSVPFLAKYLYEKWHISQALICDITWVTDGIHHGKGVAISLRDSSIPGRIFVDKVIRLAQNSGIDFQLEVEGVGSSDGRELQQSAYPFDWCFVGAPEDNVHSPDEIVHKHDIKSMIALYQYLMDRL